MSMKVETRCDGCGVVIKALDNSEDAAVCLRVSTKGGGCLHLYECGNDNEIITPFSKDLCNECLKSMHKRLSAMFLPTQGVTAPEGNDAIPDMRDYLDGKTPNVDPTPQ